MKRRAARFAFLPLAVFLLAGCGPRPPSVVEHPELAAVQVSVKTGGKAATAIGFVVSPDGLLVTSLHNLNPAEIRIALADDRDVRGILLEQDAKDDLALLKVEAGHLLYLPVNPDTAEPGLHLRAMGINGTMTHGIFEHWENSGQDINFTAEVGPVSNGSPLIGDDGRVVGVVRTPIPGKPSEYLATPIWRVVRMMPKLAGQGAEN